MDLSATCSPHSYWGMEKLLHSHCEFVSLACTSALYQTLNEKDIYNKRDFLAPWNTRDQSKSGNICGLLENIGLKNTLMECHDCSQTRVSVM